ncbi:MAG: hypothetical protein JSW62_02825 [Thermoplasmatales archaeon]|nr:MAG: hypothetical protein JSW62_02825 [Thermoplasmatales archaeon]
MERFERKLCVIFAILVFFTSGIAAGTITNNLKNNENSLIKTVMLCRYGPDGTNKLIKTDIIIDNDEKIEDAIAEKCKELAESDHEIQEYLGKLNDDNDTKDAFIFSNVRSSGKGFHFKTKINRLQFLKMPKNIPFIIKIKILLYYYNDYLNEPLNGRLNIIYCRYPKDVEANTTIKSLIGGENSTKYIEGKHSVTAIDFIGYTGWIGRFSITPFDLKPRMFFGYATIVSYNEI